MKTRLQLANGYMAGTLTPEENAVALANPVVLGEISKLTFEEMGYDGGEHEPIKRKKGKR